MADTRIDDRQSALWAQERTLAALLESSQGNNKVLQDYLKSSLSKDELAKLDQINRTADKAGKESKKAIDNIKPNFDMSLQSAFSDLQSEMKYSISGIKNSLMSADLSSALQGFGKPALQAGKNLFDLSKELPGTTRAAAMFGAGLLAYAGVATMLLKTVFDLNDNFIKLYQTGIRFEGGLKGFAQAAQDIGVSTTDLTATFTTFGSAVAYLGTNKAIQLTAQFTKLNRETGGLMMTNQQASEAVLEYTEMMRGTGLLRNMSDEELIKNSVEFNKSLNDLSAATGRQKKDIQKSIDAQKKDLDVRLALSKFGPEIQKSFSKATDGFQAFGPDMGQTMNKTLANIMSGKGLAGLPAEMTAALSQSPEMLQSLNSMAETLKNGGDVTQEQMDKLGESMSKLDAANFAAASGTNGLAGQTGKMIEQFRAAGEVQLAAQKERKRKDDEFQAKVAATQIKFNLSKEEAEKKIRKDETDELEKTKKLQDAFNATSARLQTAFQKLAVDVVMPMIPVFEGLASVVGGLVTVITYVGDTVKSIVSSIVSTVTKYLSFGMTSKGTQEETGEAVGGVAGTLATAGAGYLAYKGAKMAGGRIGKVFGFGKEGTESAAGKPPTAPGSTVEESMDKLGGTKKTLGAKMADLTSSLKEMIGNLTGAVRDAISNLSKGIGDTISNLSKGIGDAISNLSKGLGDAISNIGKGLGAGIGALIEGALKGLAAGLEAMANPAILVGAGILAGSILVIGGAIAGATWMLGAALPTMAEGLKAFDGLDGMNLIKVGGGMAAIGVGLAAMGAGEVVGALGGLASGLINFFSGKEDPITRLKRFGELSDPLSTAGDALSKFSSAFKGAIDNLNSAVLGPDVLKTMDQIKSMLGSDMSGMFGGSPKIIGQINDLSASIAKLSSSAAGASAGGAAATGGPGAISVTDLSKKTVEHYAVAEKSYATMIDLLTILADKVDKVEQATKSSSSDITKAISKASPNLM